MMLEESDPFFKISINLGHAPRYSMPVFKTLKKSQTGERTKGALALSIGLIMNLGLVEQHREMSFSTFPMTTPLYRMIAVFEQHYSICNWQV